MQAQQLPVVHFSQHATGIQTSVSVLYRLVIACMHLHTCITKPLWHLIEENHQQSDITITLHDVWALVPMHSCSVSDGAVTDDPRTIGPKDICLRACIHA
mgnify:CR=1 FL=1